MRRLFLYVLLSSTVLLLFLSSCASRKTTTNQVVALAELEKKLTVLTNDFNMLKTYVEIIDIIGEGLVTSKIPSLPVPWLSQTQDFYTLAQYKAKKINDFELSAQIASIKHAEESGNIDVLLQLYDQLLSDSYEKVVKVLGVYQSRIQDPDVEMIK